jgi:carboxypeptidase Taq
MDDATMNRYKSMYEELIKRSVEAATLASCSALLGWDEQTHMPHGGAEHRGNQVALLAGLHHEKTTHPKIGELLSELETSELIRDIEAPPSVNVRQIRRSYNRVTKLPRALVEELAKVTSVGQSEWVEARKAKNFKQFKPTLERIFALKREEASCIGIGDCAYDSLLDEFEPGARSASLKTLFAALRDDLVPLVSGIRDAEQRPDKTLLTRDFAVDRQRIFGEAIAVAVGFDFQRGNLDITAHPFCTGIGPGDCRITTRFDKNDFSEGLFGILHEVGHGLYEQGLETSHFGTPMGEAISLGVHESQSRLWENFVGRSREFWRYAFPLAKQVFHDALHDVDADAFHFAVNQVEPSFIRVQSDEVTYNLHILIRFELEHALLSGDLQAGDLPGAWNEAYAKYLGLHPADVAEGCLQDIHWSAGLVGYFPTYTLGNLYAAQLFDRVGIDLPDLPQLLARGEFAPLLDWLRTRIHKHGQRYQPVELIERATGKPLDHRPFIDALAAKYGPLYGVNLSV